MGTLDDASVRAVYNDVSNWGRWGSDDQLGTINFIGPEQRRAAAGLVQEGIAIGCARLSIPCRHR